MGFYYSNYSIEYIH